MLKVNDVLDFGSLQMKMTVREISPDSLDLEIEIAPHSGGTPLHTHPNAIEAYEVLDGKFDVFLNNDWKTYTKGQKIIVEKNTPHTFRNSSDAAAKVLNTHQPALKMAEYFEGLYKIAHSGVTKNGKMTFKAILYLSLLMVSFKDEIVPVNPPPPVANVFGFLGKLAGFRI